MLVDSAATDLVTPAELAAVDLLACLPCHAREALARQACRRRFRAGEVIFYEGDEGASLHIVRSGTVSVIRPSRDSELVLQRLAAGDVFGEVAVLNSNRRLASVVASGDCETVEVFKADLDRILEEHPGVVRKMLGLLANSLTLAKEDVARHNQVLEHRVHARTEELRETQLETVRRLGQAAESRDDATGVHIARMSRLSQRLAIAAGWSESEGETVLHATPMHDIGKIGIPDHILRKPGKLDPEEWEVMKSHTTIGAQILAGSRASVLRMAETVAMHHHEKWDGTGYPAGLAGEDIPLVARICSVCDVFDALISERPYKHAWSVDAALAEIGSQTSTRDWPSSSWRLRPSCWPKSAGPDPVRLPRLTRTAASLLVGLVVGGAVVVADAAGALERLESDTIDLRFQLRGKQPAPSVVVVAIDDVTFNELNRRWPFPRSLHARAVDRLRAAGASQIAYDVQFTEPTDDANDNALFDAVARAGHVVLSTTEVSRGGRTNVLGGDANLRSIGARAATTNLPAAAGGVFRRLPYEIEGLTTFPVAVRQAAGQRGLHRAQFGPKGAWIDYAGPPGTIKTVSFSRLVQGKLDPGVFRGKTVVVGASAPSLQDVHPAPTSGSQLMPGPEIAANAITTVQRGLPLRQTPFWLDAALIVLLALMAPVVALRLRARWAALTALGALVLYLLAAQLAFDAGKIAAVSYPTIAALLGGAAMIASSLLAESRERQRTRALFARFVPEAVVGELLDRTGGEARLGGVEQRATVMFCDLRGFTSFAERLPAARVIEVLNRYLTQMSEAILDHGCTLVSYMGDGIMAVFGSPLERRDHADCALACAREMLDQRLESFNAWLRSEYGEVSLRMGIGLNSGPVMSGNVGSERRLEYTAIGDTTNVAARLEAQTKQEGHSLLLADATREALTRQHAGLVELGPITLRGRESSIVAWTLDEPAPALENGRGSPTEAVETAGAAAS